MKGNGKVSKNKVYREGLRSGFEGSGEAQLLEQGGYGGEAAHAARGVLLVRKVLRLLPQQGRARCRVFREGSVVLEDRYIYIKKTV